MNNSTKADSKRKRLQCTIKQQHMIVTKGCGALKCKTGHCVSSGKAQPIDQDSAFKYAVNFASSNKDYTSEVLNSHVIHSLLNHSSGPLLDLLIPTLVSVISDPEKLSKSFTVRQHDETVPLGIVTVDKDEVEECFSLLFKLDNPEVDEAVCDSFGELATKLWNQLKVPESSKTYKPLLINSVVIFLLNPKLQNPEYASGCFADLCSCLAETGYRFKLNLIHYISTLPSDTITSMIYNFQQVIAIGIALKVDDETLHDVSCVCDGVACLQLLYGAVVYRSQHTIHYVLGELSLSKPSSKEVDNTPIDLYTGNPLIEELAAAEPGAANSEESPIEGAAASTLPGESEEQASSSNAVVNDTDKNFRSKSFSESLFSTERGQSEEGSTERSQSEEGNHLTDSNDTATKSDDTLDEGFTSDVSDSKDTRETRSENTPVTSSNDENLSNDILGPILALSDELERLNDLDELIEEDARRLLEFEGLLNDAGHGEDEDGAERGEEAAEEDEASTRSSSVGGARTLLRIAAGIEDDSDSDDGEDPLTSLLRIRMNGLLTGRRHVTKPDPIPKLLKKLGIDPLWDSHSTIDLSLFYNDNISQDLKMHDDYINYKSGQGFSFLNYPFVLQPHVKSIGLHFANRINMNRTLNPLLLILSGEYPYLKLIVKRSNVVEDALTRLEMVAEEDPGQLQRQLYVEFEGEEGVDEGGVSKEFFQLIIADLFNPNYGMFVEIEDTKTLWFNPQSFEVDHNYKLIGMLLGLAVYNNVILDIRFPTVLYQKLMGEPLDIRDLIQSHPMLGSSLQQLLDYPEEDVEDMFMLDFVVSTTGLFGETITDTLVEGGEAIPVTSSNKNEFVSKYVDYTLNASVSKQFEQFKKGFDMVASYSPLNVWFRPEELEKLIVGTPQLDFKALQSVTRYDNGFSSETAVVKWFWEVTHSMTDGDKSKLLAFSTGCGRAPVGGMGEMNFSIVKNGGDSERLPTAHTCFNVLLLPEYVSKEKLQTKLFSAIQHFEGFGMI